MIPDTASVVGALTGSGDVCFGGEQSPDSAPARKSQARILVRPDRARMLAAARLTSGNSTGRRVQLQYLARRLHALGERPLFHFLTEVERGADLRQHLERYAALPAAFIKANGGDRFAPIVRVIDGGDP